MLPSVLISMGCFDFLPNIDVLQSQRPCAACSFGAAPVLVLTCATLVEFTFYKPKPLGVATMCSQCGSHDGVVDLELLKAYHSVLPMCTHCKAEGKEVQCTIAIHISIHSLHLFGSHALCFFAFSLSIDLEKV